MINVYSIRSEESTWKSIFGVISQREDTYYVRYRSGSTKELRNFMYFTDPDAAFRIIQEGNLNFPTERDLGVHFDELTYKLRVVKHSTKVYPDIQRADEGLVPVEKSDFFFYHCNKGPYTYYVLYDEESGLYLGISGDNVVKGVTIREAERFPDVESAQERYHEYRYKTLYPRAFESHEGKDLGFLYGADIKIVKRRGRLLPKASSRFASLVDGPEHFTTPIMVDTEAFD